jgi:ankyrin repeat protein
MLNSLKNKMSKEHKLILDQSSSILVTAIHLYSHMPTEANLSNIEGIAKDNQLINQTDNSKKTPLHHAALLGLPNVIKLLLKAGADQDKVSSRGMTAMHYAIMMDNMDIIQALVNHGNDVQTNDSNTVTLSQNRSVSKEQDLVNSVMNSYKNTGKVDIKKLVAELDPRKFDQIRSAAVGNSSLPNGPVSSRAMDPTINAELRFYNSVNHPGIEKLTFPTLELFQDPQTTRLIKLMISRHLAEEFSSLKLCSDTDADTEISQIIKTESLVALNAGSTQNFTPLHIAAHFNDIECMTVLLERGVKVDPLHQIGFTPLMVSILGDSQRKMAGLDLLINKGANFTHSSRDGYTPLHLAVMSRNLEVFTFILNLGGKINAQYKAGGTPLHFACALGDSAITSLLLSKKATADIKDHYHWIPLHHAVRGGYDECVKLLIKHMNKVETGEYRWLTPLRVAAYENKISTAKLLIEAGAKVNLRCLYEPPIHYAIMMNHVEMTEFLLENDASLNERTQQGRTSLELALETKNLDMVKVLLKHKVRLTFNQDFTKKHLAYANQIKFLDAIPLLTSELHIEPEIKAPSPPKKEKKQIWKEEITANPISQEEQAQLLEKEAKKKEEDRLKRKAEEDKRASEEAKMKDAKKRELEIKKAKATLVKQAFNEIYDSLSKFTSSKGAAKDFFKGGMRKTAESFIDSQDKDYVQNETNIVDRQMLAHDILSSTGMKKNNPKLFDDLKQQFADVEKPVSKPASPTEIKTNDPAPAHAEPMPESQDDQKALNKLLHEQEKLQNAKAAEARKKQASSSTSAPLLMAPQSQAEAEQIRKLVYDLVLLVTPYQDQTQRSLLEMKYDIVKMDVIVSQLNKTAGKRMMEALFANTEELSIIRNGALHLLEIHSEHQHFSQEQINHFFENFYRTILERVSILATLDIQPDTRLSHTLSRIQGQSPLQLRDILAQMAAPELAHETYKQFEVNYRNHQLNKDNARSDVNEDIQNRIGILAHSAENNLSRPERVMLAVEIAELYRQRGNAGLKHGFMPYALIEARHEFAHHGINIPDELIHELLTEYQSMTLKYK